MDSHMYRTNCRSSTFWLTSCSLTLTGTSCTGKALKSKRESYQVATKFGFIFEEFTPGMDGVKGISGEPKFVREQVENSLKRLGTDHIDL